MIDTKKMREAATVLGADRWQVSGSYDDGNCIVTYEGYASRLLARRRPKVMICEPGKGSHTDAIARHIATFDPPTCIALLDRLDRVEGLLRRAKSALSEFIDCEDGVFSPDEKPLAIRLCRTVATEIKETLNDRS